MRKIVLTAICISAFAVLFAQKSLEGKITYKAELTGEGAEMARSMMPDSYEYWVGKGSILFKMNGGFAQSMLGDILITADGNMYMIKRAEKIFYNLKSEATPQQPQSKVELQDETLSILGYDCKKYKVETEVNGAPSTQYAWVTDKYKIDFAPQSKVAGAAGGIWIDGVKGIPLKIRASVMGMNSVLTATELKEEKLSKSLFMIPKGYVEKEFDPMKMLGF
ncbi:MAG: DUF4412 domain-containing protein [Chitinophagales bacterium]|nr:DUF4412 domain-containing protein [Chitinophagales bacterium]